MKKFLIALVIILVACTLVCTGIILVYGERFLEENQNVQFEDWNFSVFDRIDHNTYNINETLDIENNNFSEIKVAAVVSDIEVIKWEGNTIKAHLIGEIKLRGNKPHLEMSHSQNTLDFIVKYSSKNASTSFSNLKLYIYVPENYSNNLKLGTVSGEIEMNDFENITDLSLTSVSGDFLVDNLVGANLSITNVSGNADLIDVYFNNSKLALVSGNVDVLGNLGNASATNTSGDFYFKFLGNIQYLDFDTISGDVKLFIDNNQSANVALNSISGNYNTNIPITISSSSRSKLVFSIGNNPTVSIKMSSVSGNLKLDYN